MDDGLAIELRKVNKRYGAFHVLKHIDLRIYRGERVVVCGPSGSGKSTLIRTLNGLEGIQSGEIFVAGIRQDGTERSLRQIRKHVGMCFQHFNLYPHLTVVENCALSPIHTYRVPPQTARDNAMRCLSKVGVANQADKYPSSLSGGQQQRVAIARALCLAPEIMLFDEPTSALDPEATAGVLDAMAELASEGITTVCVTHELSFARRFADRMILMNAGEIVEDLPPAAFFQNPLHAGASEM